MSSTDTAYEHIVINENGVPMIEGTTTKVIEIVQETMAYGWSPEELHFQHPSLSLGQIYSAMAYYWDHSEELDRDIQQRMDKADRLRQITGQPPFVRRLKEIKEKGLI